MRVVVLQEEVDRYAPALALERMLPARTRKFLITLLSLLLAAAGAFSLSMAALVYLTVGQSPIAKILPQGVALVSFFLDNLAFFIGIVLLLLPLLAVVVMLSCFHNSYYFRSAEGTLGEGFSDDRNGMSYEVADVLTRSRGDLTHGFLSSPYGKELTRRLNISDDSVKAFIKEPRQKIGADSLVIPEEGFLTIRNLALYIFAQDRELAAFFFKEGIDQESREGAIAWITRLFHDRKHEKRTWSRDHLGRIPGIARGWAYGGAYRLSHFTRDIRRATVFASVSTDSAYAEEKVSQVEAILTRSKEANVMLVGDEGVGKMDVVVRLGQKMFEGKALGPIADRHMVLFDWSAFVATNNSKEAFEKNFIALLDEAARAGNVILVIERFPSFIDSTSAFGADVAELIDPYLVSPDLHVVATSDPVAYHQKMEIHQLLMRRFERVQIDAPGLEKTIGVLEDTAVAQERQFNLMLTYPAIQAVAEGADRYITDGVMPDKAVDLLIEVIAHASAQGTEVITRDFVSEYLGSKTGIPSGEIGNEEREKLLHLEEILHKRIVGQEAAIEAVSTTMRRSRTGVQSADRPIGSFLFLGPTGVGKTETAKALARVFFGSEDKMLRLDMSEYSGTDALERLIGTPESAGFFSNLLREKPYGVVLLDEFEKTTSEVKNLFLQVLDEGVFTDGRGTRINARNTIIIATSNAGSDMIWKFIEEGKDVEALRGEVVGAIISRGIFAPELVNRFDGVVVFHPLTKDDLAKIARILLGELAKRMEENGYKLDINEVLVDLLVRGGFDPQFGARPMRRVLQDKIEEKLAQKIIEGNLKRGDTITFAEQDFAS